MTDAIATNPAALLGRRSLAIYLAISTRSLDRLDVSGRLPAAIRLGGSKRWLREDIDRWLAAGAPDRATWEATK